MRNHPTHLVALLGAAVLLAQDAHAQQQGATTSRAHHGTILINAQPSGSYAETTTPGADGVESTVENTIVFNRLGSKVEYKVSGVYRQDATGDLSAAHCEVSSSKSTVVASGGTSNWSNAVAKFANQPRGNGGRKPGAGP